MRKFVSRFLFFAAILISALLLVLQFQHLVFKTNVRQKFGWVMSLRNQKLDNVFVGNSRVSEMMNTKYISQQNHSNSLNLGVAGKDFSINYLLLHYFLKNNKVETVYLQIDPFSLNKSNETYEFDFLFYNKLNDTVVFNHLLQRNSRIKLLAYRLFPKTKYLLYNSYYDLNFLQNSLREGTEFADSRGASHIPASRVLTNTKFKTHSKMEISQHNLFCLKKIIMLCKQKNVKLICYTAPVFEYQYNFNLPESDSILNSVVQQNRLTWHDYRSVDSLNKPKYFADQVHLNVTGSKIFTNIFMNKTLNKHQIE